MPSLIFTEYRNLGYVCNHIPLQIRYIVRRKEHLITTVVRNVFHTYGSSKLRLLSVSNRCQDDITALALSENLVYTASTNKISAWRRGHELEYVLTDDENISQILVIGPRLISLTENNKLKLWDLESREKLLDLNFVEKSFKITCFVHPATYLNKILLGSKQGKMQLWNLNTCKLIYTFEGWDYSVCVMEQSPAIDVIAIGLENGKIYLHNLKFDETVLKFTQQDGPVTAISFRTDGPPIMATGSTIGHVNLWNLEDKKISSQIRYAHRASISGLKFLPNEPVLVTSASDNAIKMWTFDDDVGRLLKFREGHSSPPSRIRFHDTDQILSGSQDSAVHIFSTVQDMLNRKLGVATIKRKSKGSSLDNDLALPPIIDLTSSTVREREWSNAVTAHLGNKQVVTWSTHLGKKTQSKLIHQRFRGSNASVTAICITNCGNFVIIGYSTGHVDLFNLQSSLHRGSFGDPGHTKTVTGVVSDCLNSFVVTGSLDCHLKKWTFKKKQMVDKLNIDAPVDQLVLHRDSGLLAAVTSDFDIKVLDMDTWKLVRLYEGHMNRITDVTFSPDAKWLVSSSMDSTIRTWDLITGSLVDVIDLDCPCTSLTFSPSADFLATTHVAQLGISLWINKTLYEPITLRKIYQDGEMMEDFQDDEFVTPEQISNELITLSLLPQSRWKNLLLLDVIQERNKPKEPPKAPKRAPFFLPTIPGIVPQFDWSANKESTTEKKNSSHVIKENIFDMSDFEKLVTSNRDNGEIIIAQLKSLGPSKIDYELRSLTEKSFEDFLKVILDSLQKNTDFEAIQSYLGLFLKIHWDSIIRLENCLEILSDIEKYEKNHWNRIQNRFFQSLTLVNFLKNVSL